MNKNMYKKAKMDILNVNFRAVVVRNLEKYILEGENKKQCVGLCNNENHCIPIDMKFYKEPYTGKENLFYKYDHPILFKEIKINTNIRKD